jgi:hypothetical protein
MISILFIGVVTALAVFTILAKACATGPKRPEKREKAEIVKQLLALSECENSISAAVPPVRSLSPLSDRGMRPGKFHHKPTGKTSQPIRSNK